MTYKFYPKRPVKSFQDLEVYQKLHNVGVMVIKRINPSSSLRGASETNDEAISESEQLRLPRPFGARNDIREKLTTNLIDTFLSLPVLIASAHSIRFSNHEQAVAKLEEAMLNCNLAVVYLEQYRDLYPAFQHPASERPATEIDRSWESPSLPKAEATIAEADIADVYFFDEQIKNLLSCRMKLLHLQMSWKKFMKESKNA